MCHSQFKERASSQRTQAPHLRPSGVGCWLLVVGCWLLVVGCWLLGHHPAPASPTAPPIGVPSTGSSFTFPLPATRYPLPATHYPLPFSVPLPFPINHHPSTNSHHPSDAGSPLCVRRRHGILATNPNLLPLRSSKGADCDRPLTANAAILRRCSAAQHMRSGESQSASTR